MANSKRIGALLYPGCVALDLVGPLEAFAYVAMILAEGGGKQSHGYDITLVGQQTGPVDSMSGVRLHADASYHDFEEPLDILLVPGMKSGNQSYKNPTMTAWVTAQASRSERVASVCSGAYLLAHAGLLKGHRITTHWNHGKKLKAAYPDVEVDARQIHCKSGKIYSSAGVTAGIDLALAIIEEDYDRALALKIAKRMVVFLKRPGDQAQFSDLLSAQTTTSRFGALLEWIEGHLSADLTVDAMADHCAMSPRNFSRAFGADIGMPPINYVTRRRLEHARLLLEETDMALAVVAKTTGFLSSERLTRAFRAAWRTSPGQYRKRFQ